MCALFCPEVVLFLILKPVSIFSQQPILYLHFNHLRLHRRTGWHHLTSDVCKFRTDRLENIKVYRGKLNMTPPIFAHIWWHFAYYGDVLVHLVAFYKSMSCGIDHQRLDLYFAMKQLPVLLLFMKTVSKTMDVVQSSSHMIEMMKKQIMVQWPMGY